MAESARNDDGGDYGSSAPWSISVKTVGGELMNNNDNLHQQQQQQQPYGRDFTVEVSPEDELTTLYDSIEKVTGLKASQQRLIYRGRLIGPATPASGASASKKTASNDTMGTNSSCGLEHQHDDQQQKEQQQQQRIKDIVGLGDGHTIHLVRRREEPTRSPAGSSSSSQNSSGEAGVVSSGGAGGESLLGALLGVPSVDETATASSSRAEDNNNANAIGTGSGINRRFRSPRQGTSRRRVHYRLTAEDLEVPDPGSMESVRQGLLTLHTILPHAQNTIAPADQDARVRSVTDTQRRWYRGQWIDCRDTVNTWLEATIVDILSPDDILPPRPAPLGNRSSCSHGNRTNEPSTDPAVAASDLEGRRLLLLEPCEDGSEDDEGGDLAGYRRRDSNADVQILLIHYNGWPHRWDEWIRSDSERIRPFRVRTRHPNMSTRASPTTQAGFAESPPTFFRSDTEAEDRQALLPELQRVLNVVNELVAQTATRSSSELATEPPLPGTELPWNTRSMRPGDTQPRIGPPLRRQELEALAPLLDRLGRTLTDAAPHVASLAASLPTRNEDDAQQQQASSLEPIQEHPSTLGGLLSLLGRSDRRRQASIASTSNMAVDNISTAQSASTMTGGSDQILSPGGDDGSSVDPDYSDYAAGMVNTTRGEVRSGPRTRSSQSGDDVAGLLGAYLAAASLGSLSPGSGNGDDNGDDINAANIQGLGRILRERAANGSGGGIDIHIHAVVTAPGMGTTGVGLTTLGGTAPPSPATATALPVATPVITNAFNATPPGVPISRRTSTETNTGSPSWLRSATVQHNDDDLGIFSELYSENPEPVNPNASSTTTAIPHLDESVASSTATTPQPVTPSSSASLRVDTTNTANESVEVAGATWSPSSSSVYSEMMVSASAAGLASTGPAAMMQPSSSSSSSSTRSLRSHHRRSLSSSSTSSSPRRSGRLPGMLGRVFRRNNQGD